MIKLLIIEDDEAHQELIETALEDFSSGKYDWTVRTRLEEAKSLLREEAFDLILLDLSLPDSPYNETLSRVQSFALNTPIIVLTSLDDRHTIMGLIQQGAKDCIPKSQLSGHFLERSITYCLDRERIQRKSVERERELEQIVSFHRLFNRSKIGFVICDHARRIIEVNPAFAEWLGYDREKMVGKAISEFTENSGGESCDEAIRAIREGKAREVSFEKKFRRSDGETVWGDAVVQPIQWHQQRNCFIASVFDLTERKRTEESLQAAYETKSGLISMISHDIRSPLTNIIAISSLLEDSDLSKDDRKLIESIGSSGRSMLEIVDDILTFSRAEQGGITLNEEPCRIGPLVDSVLKLFEVRAREKEIHLRVGQADRNANVLIDSHRLQQILSNLVSNAIKFTPRDGHVEIGARVLDDELVLTVADNGIGISREEQKRLFKPFSQANPKIQKSYGGTGLGLSICQQLAELMGGSISVHSEPGKGSTFTVTLPARRPQGPEAS